MLLVTLLLILENYIPKQFASLSDWDHVNEVMSIPYFLPYFTMGVIFHHLYKKYPISILSFPGFCVAFISLYLLYANETYLAKIIYLLIIALFLVMIYQRSYLFFLEKPLFRRIGVISYSTYLAHENIGVLLINKYGGWLGKWSSLSVPIVLILVILLAEGSYRFVEEKATIRLKSWL